MLAAQYTHRLPADYPMERIRERAAIRGPEWDQMPGLIFKGFLIREKGKCGAVNNAYSSLYLWQDTEAFEAMIAGSRFQSVIDTFGRPEVEAFLVPASIFNPRAPARFVGRADELLPPDANLIALKEKEENWVRGEGEKAGLFAAFSALDVTHWRLSRFTLFASKPAGENSNSAAYEAAYLAMPGLIEGRKG